MPTYGYRCPDCATEFDVFERMADEPNGRCPSCGARGVRQFFPTGIVFKGSGFYKTDSRSSNTGTSARRPAATDAKPGSDGAAATDGAKPGPASTDGAKPPPKAPATTTPERSATSSSARH